MATNQSRLAFLRHIHPPTVEARSLSPLTTLGLGLIATALCATLLLTGVLLMLYYIPSTAGAYASIQDIHAVVPFGGLARNVHRWAGHGLVAVVGLHLLRALLTGAHRGRRRRGVWTAGMWLLLVTLAFAFTGYLLPWDQLAYWAVSIGGHLASNVPLVGDALRRALLGSHEVSEATLVRFYALHVGILPAIGAGLLAVHLFRLRRAGGLARPDDEGGERRPAWPHLYERELALVGLTLAAVLAAGVLFEAPLGVEPDLARPDDPSKAPWYFLFLQELVSHSALIGGVILPGLALVTLYAVPFVDRSATDRGRWLPKATDRWSFAVGAVGGAALVGGALFWTEAGGGLDPASALLGGVGAILAAGLVLARRRGPAEAATAAVLALTGLGTTAIVTLTVFGLLRGPSWTLPWGPG